MNTLNRIKFESAPTVLSVALLVASANALAVDLDISDLPLFVTATMPPNIVLTLDDSGSMAWAYVPDGISGTGGNKRYKSSSFNALYYNPANTYLPPPKYNGGNCKLDSSNPSTCYPNVSFTAAPINGFDTSKGTVNLSTNYRPTLEYDPSSSSQSFVSTPSSGGAAFYYKFVPTNTNCVTSGTDGGLTDEDCYTYVDVTAITDDASTSDVNEATVAKQNFANWYSYYRTRNLATVSGAMSGFAGMSGNIRVAWQAINSCNSFGTNCDGWGSPGQDIDNRIRRLNAVTRTINTNTVLSQTETSVDYSYTCTVKFNQRDGDDRLELSSCNRTLPSAQDNTFPPLTGTGSPLNANSSQITVSCSNSTYCKNYTVKDTSYNDSYTSYRITISQSFSSDQTITSVVVTWTETATTTVYDTEELTHRQDLYYWLSRFPASGGTYLLKSANNAGKYFQGTVDIHHPYAEDPQITDGNHYACRRSAHVMMTDGYWCGDTSSDYSGIADVNSTATSVPKGPDGSSNYSWTPLAPYRDGQNTNLADIAFYYWANDLQSGIDNKISPIVSDPSSLTDASAKATAEWLNPKNDPATWQHLNTYTVGLGLSGSLVSPYPIWGGSTYAGDYDNLVAGTSCPTSTTSTSTSSRYCWPYTKNGESCSGFVGTTPAKVYDLWHAAIASRGKFFGTESSSDIVTAFNSILEEVADESMTAAALAANSTALETSTQLYQAQFNPSDWSGHFLTKNIDINTGVPGSEIWDAGDLIPEAGVRSIYTYTGTAGVAFTSCSTLSASQKSALDSDDSRCTDRLNWLRGSTTISDFRERKNSLLGDIVNSDPMYVKNTDFGYTALPSTTAGQSSYASYVSTNASRTPVVYVGANDGMLHAFQADTGQTNSGKELFAYIPAGVYTNLYQLTDPDYVHKYYVDGAPKAGDAYLSSAWKTVLVGGLGKGGKTIYALDVTSPTSFDQTKVMWEFPNASNIDLDATVATDLGYTFSQPQIGLLHNGVWAAIFGNGYNSSNGKAYLYIVNLSDGSLIKKIATNTATSNGLSTPYLYDSDNDKIVDAVYAGDLQGNLWKFDLSSTSSTAWGLSNSQLPLFTAINPSSQVQPITSAPVVAGHQDGGVLVIFNTGSYMTTTDTANTQVQSAYGIWDKPSATTGTVTRAQLQEQSITDTTTAYGFNVRISTSNSVDWSSKRGWRMDFPAGERGNSAPIIKYDRVVFATTLPKSDPCDAGGDTYLMEFDFLTGGAPTNSSFDINSDSTFNNSDKILINGNYYTVTGVKSTVGIAKVPIWLESGSGTTDCKAFKELSGTTGDIMTVRNRCAVPTTGTGTVNREYWLQIQ
ncbi:hypothetical protein HC024_13875 [Methylococcaceae bacterium WWC4]|nr:hypothetical protein [Methylococcaceae bacterium WWC4]